MDYDEIAFRKYSLKVDRFSREPRDITLKMLDETVLSVLHRGIVLDIDFTHVFLDCFPGLTLIESQVIHCQRVLFVLFQILGHLPCLPFRRASPDYLNQC
jgi:hypothetical protein